MDSTIPQDSPENNLTPKTTFIYVLIDPRDNTVRYVGKANDPKRRLKGHMRNDPVTYKGRWINTLRTLGLKPQMMIIEEPLFEVWTERETYWINYYLAHGYPLTNTFFGSEGVGVIPPETRAKMSASRKGRTHTPEARAKISAAHKGKKKPPVAEEVRRNRSIALRGQKRTPETRAKIAASKAGVKRAPRSAEWEQKLIRAHLGRKNTLETRAKMTESALRRTRKPFSEEARHNMGESHRGTKHSPETRAKIAAAKKGKKASPEARANMSLGRKKASAMRMIPPTL